MQSRLNQKTGSLPKTLLFLLMLIAISCLIASCGSSSGSSSGTPNKSTDDSAKTDDGLIQAEFKIGYSNFAYPPLHYFDASGKLVGFDIDLANEALALFHAKPIFIPIDWANKAEILDAGDVDMLWGGLERASLDESKFKFTKSYLRSNIVLLMPKDADYAKWGDLQGLDICALNFTPAFYYLQVYNRDVIRSHRAFTPPEYKELLNALSEDYDCMITDTSFAAFLLNTTGADYKMSDTVMNSNYAVAVRIDDTALFDCIQTALDELEANGTIAQLQEKWISIKQ